MKPHGDPLDQKFSGIIQEDFGNPNQVKHKFVKYEKGSPDQLRAYWYYDTHEVLLDDLVVVDEVEESFHIIMLRHGIYNAKEYAIIDIFDDSSNDNFKRYRTTNFKTGSNYLILGVNIVEYIKPKDRQGL